MVQLSFEIPSEGSPSRNTWDSVARLDPATISELDLCYKYFVVRVKFAVGEVKIISSERLVTLVDLALSVHHALSRLSLGQDAAIGFTESADIIRLHLEEDLVAITSSNQDWRVVLGRNEITDTFGEFVREAYSRLTERVPMLVDNPTIQGLRLG